MRVGVSLADGVLPEISVTGVFAGVTSLCFPTALRGADEVSTGVRDDGIDDPEEE